MTPEEYKFKSRICTTREQSERLLALGLRPETADMSYHHKNSKIPALEWELIVHPPTLRGKFWTPERIAKLSLSKLFGRESMTGEEVFDKLWGKDVPAWSLWRLLELLPIEIKIGKVEKVFGLYHDPTGTWNLSYPCIEYFETESPIESCVLAIDWLIDKGHFNKDYLKEEKK